MGDIGNIFKLALASSEVSRATNTTPTPAIPSLPDTPGAQANKTPQPIADQKEAVYVELSNNPSLRRKEPAVTYNARGKLSDREENLLKLEEDASESEEAQLSEDIDTTRSTAPALTAAPKSEAPSEDTPKGSLLDLVA